MFKKTKWFLWCVIHPEIAGLVQAATGIYSLGANQGWWGSQPSSGYQPNTAYGEGATQAGMAGQALAASNAAAVINPGATASLNQANAINYNPYLQGAQNSGNAYGQQAQTAGQQANIYGQQAGVAGQQQQNLYSAGNQLYQTSLDPQNALFQQTQQQLGDQVNAGQAQRGLGNSPVGGQEYNNAMSNFDINWQNQQLQRQSTGLQGMTQASNAGGSQGQLAGANLAAQSGAYGTQANAYMQQGQVPTNAQQYVAQQPGAAAAAYGQQMGTLNQLYGGNAQTAQSYMNSGINASQNAASFGASQNASGMSSLLQGLGTGPSQNASQYGTGLTGMYNNPNSWLNTTFSSPANSNITTPQQAQSNAGSFYNSLTTQP